MPRYHQILSYTEMTHREGLSLQKGMNFRVKPGYSILLMSVRKGAPYQDQWHEDRGLLEYEGHDLPRSKSLRVDPKTLDQPMRLPSGKLTENGKFYEAALNHRDHGAPAEIVQVYEKIADGIWSDRGRHELVDAAIVSVPATKSRTRNVFRFFLRPAATRDATTPDADRELKITRQIPTAVKVEVWKRDRGRCVQCGSTDNLHFDHDVPYSKGGSSLTAANVRLLCARHNLEKSDKIMTLGPLLGPLVGAVVAGWLRGA